MPGGFDPGAAGISSVGNTAGTSGSQILGTLVLAGGANITLSQSTGPGRATVSVVGGAGGAGFTGGISGGNTSGDTGTVAGSLLLAGGNNITLSGATAAGGAMTVTVSAGAGGGAGYTAGLSNIGNTAGDTGVVTGRLVLAGGNNVTLSGSTNGGSMTVTVSAANETQTVPPIGTSVEAVATASSVGTVTRFAPEDHRHAGVNLAGVSNVGNTAGNTTVQAGRLVLAGGNQITLSVGTAANGLQTVTISAAETQTVPPIGTSVEAVASASSVGTVTRFAPEDHRHAGVFSAGVSNVGNTSGNTTVQAGRLVLAGGNQITLSVGTAAGGLQTVTISAAETQTVPPIATAVKLDVSTVGSTGTITRFAPEDHQHRGVNSAGISNLGNTAGTSGVSPGRLVLAAHTNITLSQSTDGTGSTVSISAADPSAANYTFSGGMSTMGNTSGDTGYASQRLNLAGGNNITLSGSTNGGSMTITISGGAGGGGLASAGISTQGNTDGTTGFASASLQLVGTNLITLSQSTSNNGAYTVTVVGPRVPTMNRFDNAKAEALTYNFVGLNTIQTQLQVFPLCPPDDVFPGNMTVSTLLINLSGSGSSNTSGAHTYTLSFGIYTINATNNSVLSLLNSGTTTWNKAANNQNSTAYNGPRWLSIHSSNFSAALNLSQTSYFMGLVFSSAGQAQSLSFLGQNYGHSNVNRSGTLNVAGATNNTIGWYPYLGYRATAGIPNSINLTDVTHTGASGIFVPHIVMENLLSQY